MNPLSAESTSSDSPNPSSSQPGRSTDGLDVANYVLWPIRTILWLGVLGVIVATVWIAWQHEQEEREKRRQRWRNFSPGVASGEINTAVGHPLESAIELARSVQSNIDANIRDYTATVVKQERVGSELKPEEICYVKIRNQPFSVYMKFLAPENLQGQEVIYVEGANDDKLIGHAGSGLMSLAGSKWLDPKGTLAMMGQRYPITELGISILVRRLIEVGEHDMQYGECYVWRNDEAKVGDRPCISFTVLHPEKRLGFSFHMARIFVDKELMVPLHYEAYDWPAKPGDKPPLLESYTYARLKLNPGLTDADFDPKNPEYNFGLK